MAFALKCCINKRTILRGYGALAFANLVALVVVVISIDDLPKWGRIVSIVGGAILGWFIIVILIRVRANLEQNSVYVWTSAFIGAFFLMHGIGQIAGGFPPIAIRGLKE